MRIYSPRLKRYLVIDNHFLKLQNFTHRLSLASLFPFLFYHALPCSIRFHPDLFNHIFSFSSLLNPSPTPPLLLSLCTLTFPFIYYLPYPTSPTFHFPPLLPLPSPTSPRYTSPNLSYFPSSHFSFHYFPFFPFHPLPTSPFLPTSTFPIWKNERRTHTRPKLVKKLSL